MPVGADESMLLSFGAGAPGMGWEMATVLAGELCVTARAPVSA